MGGPLDGLTVLEIAGIGPGPFAGMMLADMGATVITVDRPGGNPSAQAGHDVLFRSRRHIAVDLKSGAGVETLLQMVERSHGLFEGFRPGVAERLGFGPDACLARNRGLVYGRMTGWGQDGPMAGMAGHDINYVALSGALHAIGRAGERPTVPLNLVGDFGGGGMLLAYGMVCGLLHAATGGAGQVVDAAMVDGASALMAMFFHLRALDQFSLHRGANLLDSGAYFYDVYETADHRYISLGSIEPQFYEVFLDKLGLADDPAFAPDTQADRTTWARRKDRVAEVIASRTREQWDELLSGTDVCYAPVLDLDEVADHPHHRHRGTHVTVDGVRQAAPAPRFSQTSTDTPTARRPAGSHTREVLSDFGFSEFEIADLLASGAVTQAPPEDMR